MGINRRAHRRQGSATPAFGGNFLSVLPGAFQIMVSDQGVTNGATMIRADQSGNGKDYTTIANQPTTASTLSGRATLLFNGTSQVLPSSLNLVAPGTTPWEMVMVVKQVTWVGGGRITSDAVDGCCIFNAGASPGIAEFTAPGTVSPTHNGLTVGTWLLLKSRHTNSASDLLQAGSAVATTGFVMGNVASNGRTIGAGGAFFTNIEVALVAYGPIGFAGATFLAALDTYYGGLVAHP